MSSPLDAAIELLRAGRPAEAARLLAPVAHAGDADATHLLGLARRDQHDLDAAEDLVRRAIARAPTVAIYRASLGMILSEKGDPSGAIEALAKAVALDPDRADLRHNHGMALARAARFSEAAEAYRRALALDPALVCARAGLGRALHECGHTDEAARELEATVKADPGCTDARWALARLACAMDDAEGAARNLEAALAADPRHAPSLVLASLLATAGGREAEAEAAARRAIQVAPNEPAAHAALGDALAAKKLLDEALKSYERAMELSPDDGRYAAAWAMTALSRGDFDAAHDRLEAWRARAPNDPKVLDALAFTAYYCGAQAEALAWAKQSIARAPERLLPRSFLLGVQYADDSTPPEEALAHAKEWGRLAARRAERRPIEIRRPDPERPLRVGYVSPDLRAHPVGHLLGPLLARHDPRAVRAFLYANQTVQDEVTQALRRCQHTWRSIAEFSDDAAADLVRSDEIDVLVDLAGHTQGNRLEVFARKPAPVQATWMGYYATTGLAEIDWIVCDDVVLPPGEERWFVERPWRLPGCYVPFSRMRLATVVGPLPMLRAGHVTFGCFNNLVKMTDRTVDAWARILTRVPGSRLLLKTGSLGSRRVQETVRERFATRGVRADRLVLSPGSPRLELLRVYNDVDLALDPFPYNGGMSSLEAMHMGVPVVMKRGATFVSRIGETIARAVGVPQLVAPDEEAYVDLAVRLANDPVELSTLRASLRGRVDRVADPAGYVRNLEVAFRGMWKAFLARGADGSGKVPPP